MTNSTYWLIERGSPREWWGGDAIRWTTDSAKALRFNEWGARKHAEELELPITQGGRWAETGPLRATEHMDCDGPAAGQPVRDTNGPLGPTIPAPIQPVAHTGYSPLPAGRSSTPTCSTR